MPAVPKLRLTVDQRPLPAVQINTPRGTVATEGGAMGEAMQRVGQQATQLGLQLLEQNRIRKRQILQLEAGQQLDQLEHLTLAAPDRGLLLKEGKAPMELRDQYLSDFDTQASEIAKQARTPEEQILVRSMIESRRAQVLTRIDAHASGELRKYEYGTLQASLASTVNRMASHADDPTVRAEAIGEVDRMLRTHGPRFGITGEVLEQAIDQAKAKGHAAVVNQLLFDRKHAAAAKYFDSVKDGIQDTDARQAIQAKVDAGTTEQKAYGVVDEVMATLAPKDDETPFQTDVIEKAIRERLTDDPDAYKAAIAEFRSRKAGMEDARQQRTDVLQNPLLEAILDGASSRQVRAMPQWKDAPAAMQYRIAQMIEQRDARAQAERNAVISRGREDERWRQYITEQAEWSRFGELSIGERLSKLSEAEMLKEALTFESQALRERYRSEWQRLQRESNGQAAVTLTDDDARGVFARSGYGWAASDQPGQWRDNDRALYARVVAAAREEIARQQTGNKQLSIEAKNKIVQDLLDQKVMVQGMFYPSEVVGVAVDPSDRSRAYVPLAKIPRAQLSAAIAWFRTNTADGKANARLTDEQLARKFAARFENAYAAQLMGLGTEAQFTELRRSRERGR